MTKDHKSITGPEVVLVIFLILMGVAWLVGWLVLIALADNGENSAEISDGGAILLCALYLGPPLWLWSKASDIINRYSEGATHDTDG